MRWLRDHSLTLVLLAIMAASLVYSLAVDAEAKDIASNVFGDTWGAFLIVVVTKWFTERGGHPSTESK
jgi:hypothetical protein